MKELKDIIPNCSECSNDVFMCHCEDGFKPETKETMTIDSAIKHSLMMNNNVLRLN